MKRIFRHLHLWLSVPFGLAISLICFTGAILVFERPITEGLAPHLYRAEPAPGQQALPPHRLLAAVRAQVPDSLHVASLQCGGEGRAAFITFRETGRRTLSVNPYTGQANGWVEGNAFFRTVRKAAPLVHGRATPQGRPHAGQGAGGHQHRAHGRHPGERRGHLAAPHPPGLKNRLAVHVRRGWPRLWHDLHVSAGFYASLLLLVMALTGLTWSYPGYRKAVYALLGADTNPPKSAPRQTVRPSSASEPDPLVWTQVLAGLQARYPASASFKLEHGTAQAIPATAMRRADTYRFDPATGRITHTQLHRDKPRSQTAKGTALRPAHRLVGRVGHAGGLLPRRPRRRHASPHRVLPVDKEDEKTPNPLKGALGRCEEGRHRAHIVFYLFAFRGSSHSLSGTLCRDFGSASAASGRQ